MSRFIPNYLFFSLSQKRVISEVSSCNKEEVENLVVKERARAKLIGSLAEVREMFSCMEGFLKEKNLNEASSQLILIKSKPFQMQFI